ncbi:MAG: hypothetical protein V3T23_00300 [Nitrososphaerales archaeon]
MGQEGLLQCSPTKWSVSYASKDKNWSESRFPDIEERCLGVTTITALLLVIPLGSNWSINDEWRREKERTYQTEIIGGAYARN